MLRKLIIVLALGLLLATPATARVYKNDATMLVSPSVFVNTFKGDKLSIHTEIGYSTVDRTSLVLSGAGSETITPLRTYSDARGNLVMKFRTEDFNKIVEEPRTDLTLTGNYVDGGSFELHASVRVKLVD
jgi:hypothetical protein